MPGRVSLLSHDHCSLSALSLYLNIKLTNSKLLLSFPVHNYLLSHQSASPHICCPKYGKKKSPFFPTTILQLPKTHTHRCRCDLSLQLLLSPKPFLSTDPDCLTQGRCAALLVSQSAGSIRDNRPLHTPFQSSFCLRDKFLSTL